MDKKKAVKANQDAQSVQQAITKQWNNFASLTGRAAYEDLMSYIDDQREMYRKYAEERQMPHPSTGAPIPIDNETISACLQNSRGLNIVKTYITMRVNAEDVAQKTTK